MTRRNFLGSLLGASMTLTAHSRRTSAATRSIRALALDGFTTFDPRPLRALAERLFPGRGGELASAWRTRQFEYSWLRVAMHRYTDFWTVTEEALIYAAQASRLELSAVQRSALMDAVLRLPAYPDARPALAALRDAGLRVAFLTNLSPRMLDALIDHAGLRSLVDLGLSTDAVRSYKPDPRTYQLGVDALGLDREEIAFVASSGWDAAGARAFGYPTLWVNRVGQPPEQLGVSADAVGESLNDLTSFVRR